MRFSRCSYVNIRGCLRCRIVRILICFTAVICLQATSLALINPSFTPVNLVKQGETIAHLELTLSADASILKSRVVETLKGEAPEAFIVNVPFHLRKKMSEIAEDRAISAVFAAGDFVEASVKGVKRGDAVFAMIKTDAGWYGLYGERSPFRLGQDPLDLRAVWAGSADMLASAIRYIQANPFRAEIPVRAGVEWVGISKVAEGLVDVNALQPVALADGRRLLFAASVNGDKLFKFGGPGAVSARASDLRLESKSLKAAWGDMNGDGQPDLISWSGSICGVYSIEGKSMRHLASTEFSQTVYSLSFAVLESGGAGVVIAGTDKGPQVLRLSSDHGSLTLSGLIPDKNAGAGGPCAVADVTGDGLNDIVEATKDNLRLYVGLVGGAFMPARICADTFGLDLKLAPLVCDMNGDGLLDIIMSGVDGTEPYLNVGDGKFLNMRPVSGELAYVGKPNVVSSSTADLNNDGKQELVLFYKEQGPLPFFNRGFVCFGYAGELELRNSALPFSDTLMQGQQAGVVVDIDADGKQEVIIVSSAGELLLLRTAAFSKRPLLSLEVVSRLGEISPRCVSAEAKAQVMGARNVGGVFPSFWGVRRKGPVALFYKTSSGDDHSDRNIVIEPFFHRLSE